MGVRRIVAEVENMCFGYRWSCIRREFARIILVFGAMILGVTLFSRHKGVVGVVLILGVAFLLKAIFCCNNERGATIPDAADPDLERPPSRNKAWLTRANKITSLRQSSSIAMAILDGASGKQPVEQEPEDPDGTSQSLLRSLGDTADLHVPPRTINDDWSSRPSLSAGASTSYGTREEYPQDKEAKVAEDTNTSRLRHLLSMIDEAEIQPVDISLERYKSDQTPEAIRPKAIRGFLPNPLMSRLFRPRADEGSKD